MAVPYLSINSMSYTYSAGITNGVLTINTNYSYLRGGGSVSIAGLTQTLYYNISNSSGNAIVNTFSVKIATASVTNLTFSFYKGPYVKYPLNQPSSTGITQSRTASSCGPFVPYSGGIPYNLGIAPVNNPTILYETSRTYNYTFRNV